MAVNGSCCSGDRLGRPTGVLAVSISSPGRSGGGGRGLSGGTWVKGHVCPRRLPLGENRHESMFPTAWTPVHKELIEDGSAQRGLRAAGHKGAVLVPPARPRVLSDTQRQAGRRGVTGSAE